MIKFSNIYSIIEMNQYPYFTRRGVWEKLRNEKLLIFSLCFFLYNFTSAQDFQISEMGTASFAPQISTDSIGNFVVVWTDYRNAKGIYEGTGSDGDVYGQYYNYQGIPIGGNFRISDDSINTEISFAGQFFSRIAMNKRGEFVVTWIDTRPRGTPYDSSLPLDFNIYAQKFDLNGSPIGSNLLINDDTTGGQLNPDIIIRRDGSFVIIWENTADNKNIYLQSFDSTSIRVGLNQKLNLKGEQPIITLFDNNNFVVAGDSIAQIFSFPSNQIGSPFNIPIAFSKEIKVSNNKLYQVFNERRIILDRYEDFDIYLQAYDTTGIVITDKIKVNDDHTDYWQVSPSLSIDDSLIFVTWQDYRNGYQIGDGECIDIYGQRFDLNLLRIGSNFKASHEANQSGQINPTTALRNSVIYIAWLDSRSMEFFSVNPPQYKNDVWGTILDFDSPIEGALIYCSPPPQQPSAFKFFYSYPNPTQAESTFIYDLPENANVKISLYNILGKEVKILITEFHNAGRYIRSFINNDLSSGVYFARIIVKTSSGNLLSSTIKIALIK